MPIFLEPVLQACRDIYDLAGTMQRYWAYVDLMTKARGEFLPLGAFSPMGKRQAEYLDGLIALDAESHAAQIAEQAMLELGSKRTYRMALVVIDEPRNGWTQRHLSDADWRFVSPTEIHTNTPRIFCDAWLTVQLWTTTFFGETQAPTLEYLRQETRAAVARAEYQQQHPNPKSLVHMLHQEGTVLRFSGEYIAISNDDLEYSRAVLEPLLECQHYPTNFAALYGDEAAKSVGYPALGLSARAGFGVAQKWFSGDLENKVF
ncbi:MAG: hypothetical protein ACK41E_07060 [Deinococcales bacterium]